MSTTASHSGTRIIVVLLTVAMILAVVVLLTIAMILAVVVLPVIKLQNINGIVCYIIRRVNIARYTNHCTIRETGYRILRQFPTHVNRRYRCVRPHRITTYICRSHQSRTVLIAHFDVPILTISMNVRQSNRNNISYNYRISLLTNAGLGIITN